MYSCRVAPLPAVNTTRLRYFYTGSFTAAYSGVPKDIRLYNNLLENMVRDINTSFKHTEICEEEDYLTRMCGRMKSSVPREVI